MEKEEIYEKYLELEKKFELPSFSKEKIQEMPSAIHTKKALECDSQEILDLGFGMNFTWNRLNKMAIQDEEAGKKTSPAIKDFEEYDSFLKEVRGFVKNNCLCNPIAKKPAKWTKAYEKFLEE